MSAEAALLMESSVRRTSTPGAPSTVCGHCGRGGEAREPSPCWGPPNPGSEPDTQTPVSFSPTLML